MTTTGRQVRRVLVVDDNLDTVRTLTHLLRDMGHHVEFAINGFAALEAARRFRPQVVLLDLNLPDRDGVDLARQLRGQSSEARIIAVTGREGDRQRAIQAGCADYVLKPLDPRQLEKLVV